MSFSVRWYSESINRVCRLKVKVNFQGHGIYPLQFPVRSKSPEPFKRFSLNFTKCSVRRDGVRSHDSAMESLVQCHSSRSWDLPLKLVSATYLRTLWKLFIKLHPNVPLSETVSRSNYSATMTLKGHGLISRSWDIFTL